MYISIYSSDLINNTKISNNFDLEKQKLNYDFNFVYSYCFLIAKNYISNYDLENLFVYSRKNIYDINIRLFDSMEIDLLLDVLCICVQDNQNNKDIDFVKSTIFKVFDEYYHDNKYKIFKEKIDLSNEFSKIKFILQQLNIFVDKTFENISYLIYIKKISFDDLEQQNKYKISLDKLKKDILLLNLINLQDDNYLSVFEKIYQAVKKCETIDKYILTELKNISKEKIKKRVNNKQDYYLSSFKKAKTDNIKEENMQLQIYSPHFNNTNNNKVYNEDLINLSKQTTSQIITLKKIENTSEILEFKEVENNFEFQEIVLDRITNKRICKNKIIKQKQSFFKKTPKNNSLQQCCQNKTSSKQNLDCENNQLQNESQSKFNNSLKLKTNYFDNEDDMDNEDSFDAYYNNPVYKSNEDIFKFPIKENNIEPENDVFDEIEEENKANSNKDFFCLLSDDNDSNHIEYHNNIQNNNFIFPNQFTNNYQNNMNFMLQQYNSNCFDQK